ncbi:hypothetical protein [Sphingobium lignivorans]|uniref:Lipoprotein n=1 Tax=Sphingobium lignivorans TaxID=2735886 RepID=A0ABR6NCB3_9SPHN|nr:hypothetical protein [Sphingobium lignivorans]MBB5984919.1 hypothetical protein [Sphingobium lignivorans]
MRRFLVLCCPMLLVACGSDQSFDERYNEQAQSIDTTASNIQEELSRQMNASAQAGRLRTDPNAPDTMVNQAQP